LAMLVFYFHTWKRGGWYWIEDTINYHDYGINRIERDRWNSNSIINHLMEGGFEVSTFQTISNFPIPQRCLKKSFIKHDGNWWWNGCFRLCYNWRS
jgi:hypothetical protein